MKFFVAIFLLIGVLSVQSRYCAHQEYNSDLIKRDPMMKELRDAHELRLKSRSVKRASGDTYTIPTVVHIIYNTAKQNLTDGAIIDQIARLNIDYRRLNDYSSTVEEFKTLPTDSGIQFILATTDPDGQPTNGITRTYTATTQFASYGSTCQRAINGGADAWDTKRYMNIWVCNIGSDKLGFAQLPFSSANATDGIVINSGAFGYVSDPPTPYNLGRTLTHEVGHWLDLLHPWGNFTGDCNEDDEVADTPFTDDESYRCNLTRQSCGVTTQVQNYMDYSDDNCMTLFTPLQVARMRDLLDPVTGWRKLNSIVNYTGIVLGTNGTYVSPYGPLPGPVPNTPTDDPNGGGLSIDDFRSGTYLYILIAVAACIALTLCCAILGSIRRCCKRR